MNSRQARWLNSTMIIQIRYTTILPILLTSSGVDEQTYRWAWQADGYQDVKSVTPLTTEFPLKLYRFDEPLAQI
jgi:hypothetical protein